MVEMMSGAGVCFRVRTAGHGEFKLLSPKERKEIRDFSTFLFILYRFRRSLKTQNSN